MGYLRKAKTILKNVVGPRRHTVCPFLWDSVYVDLSGKVYTCCHGKPAVLGDIYDSTLEHIWKHSLVLRSARWAGRHRCLHCFFDCTILPITLKASPPSALPKLQYPHRLWILFTEFCNISCIMCWQDHRNQHCLDIEVLKKQVDWAKIDDIVLQGGEFLAIKKGKEFYRWMTREKGKKVRIITNGTLIDDEWADLLAQGSSRIAISVNAATKETHEKINCGSSFDRVIDGIRKLIAVKRTGNLDVHIRYKFTIVPENITEIADAIVLANTLGCDEFAFGYDASVPDLLQGRPDLVNRLKDDLNKILAENLDIQIIRNRLEILGLLDVMQEPPR
ncbi:MAG: hypothetical protein DRP66_01885 [Planctomycetota bacterium]|nr:MAG: hypothetical protein DRP66_01885 [Planctomycetota bacterium]